MAWASSQPLPHLPETASELWALAAAVGAYLVSMAIRGERVRRFTARNGGRLGHGEAAGITYTSFALNTVLPARAGDAARVWLASRRGQIGLRAATGILVVERLLDAGVLLVLFLVLAYGLLEGIDAPAIAAVTIPAVLGVVAVGAGLTLLRPDRPGRLGSIARALDPALAAARSLRGRFAATMVGLTLAIWAAEGMTYLAVSWSVGVDLSPLEALYVIGVAGVFVLVPSGPGYAGTLDAAIIFALRAIGAGGRATFSYLVTLRFVIFIPVVVIGTTLLVTRYGGLAAIRAMREKDPPEETA